MDQNVTFRQAVTYIREMRREYEDTLRLFDTTRKAIEYRRNMRNKFYALNMKEGQIDKLWSYMNGDVELLTLQEACLTKRMIRQQDKKML